MGKKMKNRIKLKTAINVSVSSLLLMASSAQSSAIDCSAFEQWVDGGTYSAGKKVATQDKGFEAKWWNQSDPTKKSGPWQEWKRRVPRRH